MIVNIDHLAKIVPPGAVEAKDNFVPIPSKEAARCKVTGISGSKTHLPSVVIIECGNGAKICMTAFMILSSFAGIVQIKTNDLLAGRIFIRMLWMLPNE